MAITPDMRADDGSYEVRSPSVRSQTRELCIESNFARCGWSDFGFAWAGGCWGTNGD